MDFGFSFISYIVILTIINTEFKNLFAALAFFQLINIRIPICLIIELSF